MGDVVNRTVSDSGVVEEYVKDKASELIWSPNAPKYMNWAEANAYCESKKDLGLKWALPSKEDFRVAFHPNNPDRNNIPYNERLLEALDTHNRFLWSSSGDGVYYALGYGGNFGFIDEGYRGSRVSVRCVGRR